MDIFFYKNTYPPNPEYQMTSSPPYPIVNGNLIVMIILFVHKGQFFTINK